MDPQAIKDWAAGATGDVAGAGPVEEVVDDTTDEGAEDMAYTSLQEVADGLLDCADSADALLADIEDKGDIPDKIVALREMAEALKAKGEELDEDVSDEDGADEVAVEA